jgi:hypothetical protein
LPRGHVARSLRPWSLLLRNDRPIRVAPGEGIRPLRSRARRHPSTGDLPTAAWSTPGFRGGLPIGNRSVAGRVVLRGLFVLHLGLSGEGGGETIAGSAGTTGGADGTDTDADQTGFGDPSPTIFPIHKTEHLYSPSVVNGVRPERQYGFHRLVSKWGIKRFCLL